MRKKKTGLKEGLLKLGVFKLFGYAGWRQWEESEELKTEERERIMAGIRSVSRQKGIKEDQSASDRRQ